MFPCRPGIVLSCWALANLLSNSFLSLLAKGWLRRVSFIWNPSMSSSCRPLQLWKGYRGHCWTAWLNCFALPPVTSVAHSHTEMHREQTSACKMSSRFVQLPFQCSALSIPSRVPRRKKWVLQSILCGISAVNGCCESICPECSTCSLSSWFDFLLPAHLYSEFLCFSFPFYWPLFCPLIDLLNQPIWYSCFCVQTSCIIKKTSKIWGLHLVSN